jgi:DNA mismatch endonuclease (patch repair protein)
MDSITKEHRSWNMSRIRSKNTKPEMLVRRYLYSKGIRYRLHAKLPGKPDIAMKQRQSVVFVNGCFWHGHIGCKYFRLPKSNNDYWDAKINGNIARDTRNYMALQEQGWRCIVIWECQIKHSRDDTLQQLYSEVTQ